MSDIKLAVDNSAKVNKSDEATIGDQVETVTTTDAELAETTTEEVAEVSDTETATEDTVDNRVVEFEKESGIVFIPIKLTSTLDFLGKLTSVHAELQEKQKVVSSEINRLIDVAIATNSDLTEEHRGLGYNLEADAFVFSSVAATSEEEARSSEVTVALAEKDHDFLKSMMEANHTNSKTLAENHENVMAVIRALLLEQGSDFELTDTHGVQVDFAESRFVIYPPREQQIELITSRVRLDILAKAEEAGITLTDKELEEQTTEGVTDFIIYNQARAEAEARGEEWIEGSTVEVTAVNEIGQPIKFKVTPPVTQDEVPTETVEAANDVDTSA